MTLREYLQVVRERWMIVVAGLLIGVIAAVAVTALSTREYSSSVTLYVASAASGDNTTAQYQGTLLSQQRVKSYTEMITSPRITGPASAQVGGRGGGTVTASSQPNTVLITTTVTDTDPQRAAAMADAVAAVFTQSVATLEQSPDRTRPPDVSIQVFEPATVPTSPTSPKPMVNLALGALLGLVLGLGAGFARHVLDTRIRSVEEVERIADAPTLGAIAFDKRTADQPLILDSEPSSPRAEAFRQARTNLSFVGVENDRKVIVVTSSLPAEGKSFSACNLALALSAAGTPVVLVEGDLRRPRVADYFGIERTVGLTSVLTGRVSLDHALQPWGSAPRLRILTSGVLPPNPSELLGSRNMADLLDELGRRFAVVIVDAPPLLPVTDAAAVGRLCDGAVVVVRHGTTTRPQLQAALGALDAASVRVLGTIVNAVPTAGPGAYHQYGAYYTTEDHHAREDKAFAIDKPQTLQTVPMRTVGPRPRTEGAVDDPPRTRSSRRRPTGAGSLVEGVPDQDQEGGDERRRETAGRRAPTGRR